MVTITLHEFCADAGMLLRDHPRGTAARLTQHVIAWWSGRNLVFAYLREENEALIEEELDPFDLLWDEWADAFQRWRDMPIFERFDEIEQWIRDAPPYAGGDVD